MRRILALLTILVLASLACSLGPKANVVPTPTRVPPSSQDVAQLQQEVATASANLATSGKLNVAFTEQQLTALIMDGLAKQPDVPLTEPQITLRDGQMTLSGKTIFAGLTVPAELILKPYAESGNLKVTIVTAKFGGIPVPEKTLTQLTDTINSNLKDSISVEGKQIDIQTIVVSEGKLIITGTAR